MSRILDKLKGGDLRSIGRSEEVVQDILKQPGLFGEVFEGMLSGDPVIRMRCADAIEKVSSMRPGYLQPHKQRLIDEVSRIRQKRSVGTWPRCSPSLWSTPRRRMRWCESSSPIYGATMV